MWMKIIIIIIIIMKIIIMIIIIMIIITIIIIIELFTRGPKNGVRILYTFKFQLYHDLHNL